MKNLTSLATKFKGKLVRQKLFYSSHEPKIQKDIIAFESNVMVCFVRESFARKKFNPEKLYVIRTLLPDQTGSLIEGVNPGAMILLKVSGESRIRKTMECLNTIMKSGVDLNQLSDSVFLAIQGRNEARVGLEFLTERVIEDSKLR